MGHHHRKYIVWAAPWRLPGSGKGPTSCGTTQADRSRTLPHEPERYIVTHIGNALPASKQVLTLRERKRLRLLAQRYRVQREVRLRPMGEILLERRLRRGSGAEIPGFGYAPPKMEP